MDLIHLAAEACKAYMKAGFLYTARHIIDSPLPEDATDEMASARTALIEAEKTQGFSEIYNLK